jgi:adenosylmethionine-8-amino-7-oxononanoate aminotransferase
MPNKHTQQIIADAKDHIWFGHMQVRDHDDPTPMGVMAKGEGCYIIDAEGKRYLDVTGGSHCCAVGHGRKEIADAVYKQMLNLEFASSGILPFVSEATAKLSKKIADLAPGDLQKVYYTLSGSEAVEASLKIVRQYHAQNGNPKKYKVLYRDYSHHGYTWGAMSVSGDPAIRSNVFEPTIPMGVVVPEGNPYRCLYCTGKCNMGCFKAIEKTVKYEDPNSIAAFIVEPIAKGALVPRDDFWPSVRELCDKNDILLICDEVVTAFGRTGTWFGGDHWGLIPDLMVLGKTLGGGYQPVGAVVTTMDVYERFLGSPDKTLVQAHTLGGHPVVSTAALTNLEIIERENLVERAAKMGPYLKTQLETLKEHPVVGEVTSIGLLAGIQLVKDKKTREPLGGKEVGKKLTQFMVSQGLYERCGGSVLFIHPSLTITKEDIDFMVAAFDKTLTYAERELI